jgi:aminodeoxyfutalosine deaminase
LPASNERRERARTRVGPLTLLDIRRRTPFHGAEEAERESFRKAVEVANSTFPSIIGIGLGGDERRTGSEPFRALYAQSGAVAGLRLTNHAGETTGPEAIREALAIGSERIGHALSAIRDLTLSFEELKMHEQCPWS